MAFKFRSKKSSSLSFAPALNKKLDHKLIDKTNSRTIPSLRQLRYVGEFLSHGEKRSLFLFILVIVFTAIIWISFFLYSHLTLVPGIGGNYNEALVGQPKYVNPLFASANDVDNDISSLVYSGLFRYQNGKLVPDLAKDYTVSSDGKNYDITLKSNIVWSDGVAFEIDDVIHTLELIQNPETSSPLYESFQDVTIKKINDTTLRLTLKQPYAPFIHNLTVGILPKHTWEKVSDPAALKLAKANLDPVGTGPWKLDHYTKNSDGTLQKYILERNENYYGQKPYFKTFTFTFFSDNSLAIQKIHNQDVDGLAFTPRTQNDLLTSRNLASYSLELPQYTALFFNLKDELLKDKDVRAALRTGTNKELIIKEVFDGNAKIVESPILFSMIGFNPRATTTIFNSDQANAVLDKKWTKIQPEEYFKIRKSEVVADYQADLEDQLRTPSTTTSSLEQSIKAELAQADSRLSEAVQNEMSQKQLFYRKDKNNHLLTITITCLDTSEQQKIAEVIAKQWQLLGISTTIEQISAERLRREILRGHNFQALLYGELVGADPDPFPLWHSNQITFPGLNISQFNNRTADKYLEDARGTLDLKTRESLYLKFQDILADEIPALFLFTPRYSYVINKDIQGVRFETLITPSDRFNTLSEWYTKKKFVWR